MEGVAFVQFTAADVVRHSLVTRIVRAYAAHDAGKTGEGDLFGGDK
jgi:phosphate starvation-inducible PhoH-like protein